MPLPTKLIATLRRSYDRRPLIVVENMPGEGVELFPQQARALAQALVAAADAAERQFPLPAPRGELSKVTAEFDLQQPSPIKPSHV